MGDSPYPNLPAAASHLPGLSQWPPGPTAHSASLHVTAVGKGLVRATHPLSFDLLQPRLSLVVLSLVAVLPAGLRLED